MFGLLKRPRKPLVTNQPVAAEAGTAPGLPPNNPLNLTGAAILVLRGTMFFEAAPAS